MPLPLKEAVAVAIPCLQDQRCLLLVQRPEAPGEELPGVWGLPAASLWPGEDDAAALERLGRQKLGAQVQPLRLLAQGQHQRAGYLLLMRLYQALLAGEPHLAAVADEGITLYTDWRWAKPESLQEAAAQGSLCSRLFLHSLESSHR
ncbi:MAG: NUDIX domain-containing protein [Dehalococcoidia bacterium]